jgi:hypothetical protein
MTRETSVYIACVFLLAACAPDAPLAPRRITIPTLSTTISATVCPQKFTPMMGANTAEDRNGDGEVCALYDAGQVLLAIVDNNVPASQTGGCPGNFVAFDYMLPGDGLYDPTDRNQNQRLCAMSLRSGEKVIVDDNDRTP